MRKNFLRLIIALFLVWMTLPLATSQAIEIEYQATDLTDTTLGEDLWEYTYWVTDYDFLQDYEFTIYFDYDDVGRVDPDGVVSAPNSGWSVLTWNPDQILPDDGAFDALALVDHASLSDPFTVQFVWIGSGSPGSQYFEVYNGLTWETLDSGDTVQRSPAPVPEPATFLLLTVGLLGLAGLKKKSWTQGIIGSKQVAAIGICLLIAFSIAFAPCRQTAWAGPDEDLSIDNYVLVGKKRVGRTIFEYTFTAEVTNSGSSGYSQVHGSVTSNNPHTVIVDGELDFPDVGPGEVKTSLDTFSFRQNCRYPFDPNALTWRITGEPISQNQPPSITSEPVTSAVAGQQYSYDVEATDPDPGDDLTFDLVASPQGMTIDADTGFIQWTPGLDQGGENQVSVQVTDSGGLSDTQTFTVTVTVNAPLIESFTANPETIGSGQSTTLSWEINNAISASIDQGIGVIDPVSGSITVTPDQSTTYTLTATNPGGETTATVTVTVSSNLPPDPAQVAPPLDQTVVTTLKAATEFLYTGANPIQTGVDPETIDIVRVAVLRGKVIDREGAPLPGVTISILNHSEFGQTLSRQDGMFDLVVNGGGPLVVQYQKQGFLKAQRTVEVPWQEYVHVPDVALIQLDPEVTTVDLDAPGLKVARGSVVTDSDGTRQATIFFPEGISAHLVMPDGSTQPISTINVRATEYTVGPNGPAAMPAELPPTSGYTYAVELSVDEAIEEGAASVAFDAPVSFFVENFIGMPVGLKVPTAYYDFAKSAWVPIPDGKVIKIVSESGGVAQVDTDGDGTADNQGLSEAERIQLASMYSAGQELWHSRFDHFSAIDNNFGVAASASATRPIVRRPRGARTDFEEEPNEIDEWGTVDIENQVFRESLPVVGTTLSLNYGSDSAEGYSHGNVVHISLMEDISDEALAILERIDVIISIAGREFLMQYDPRTVSPGDTVEFEWDGKDVYGRDVTGERRARIQINYVYPAYYLVPAPEDNSFGVPSGTLISSGIIARNQKAKLSKAFTVILGRRPFGDTGGWSINVHHMYDPVEGILYLGNGGRRSAPNSNIPTLNFVAGTGVYGFAGDGGSATEALLNGPHGIAVGPDGSIYIADSGNNRIRKVFPNGTISTIAGTGVAGFSGDGGDALSARLNYPTDVALGPDGSVYIADSGNNRVRRIFPNGSISTVAGNGDSGFNGDGIPATEASLSSPNGIAVAPDGTLFIADRYNSRVRRVGPDGIITTYGGGGDNGCDVEGIPATEASMAEPYDVALGLDGSLYVVDSVVGTVRKISTDGIITTVAGIPDTLYCSYPKGSLFAKYFGISSMLNSLFSLLNPKEAIAGFVNNEAVYEGDVATEVEITNPLRVDVASDGSFYLSTQSGIHRVGATGMITTIAGGGDIWEPELEDGMSARQAGLGAVEGLAVSPDGGLFFSSASRVLNITKGFPGIKETDIIIPSSDGALIYRFDFEGRHLETLHALTGQVLLNFGYDSEGRLISITNRDGRVTTIERDVEGNPTAIVSPYGQTTTLSVNASGLLESITNPAGESITLGYSPGGLLTEVRGPRDNAYTFQYDDQGLLISMTDPLNSQSTLSRTELADGHQVTLTSAEGRSTIYRIQKDAAGVKTRTVVGPSGLTTTTIIRTDATTETNLPDGTVIQTVLGPDPRFGMMAPITTTNKLITPDGIETIETLERTVVLSDPDDISSLVSITDVNSINGRQFVTSYEAATRTFTTTSPLGRSTISRIDEKGRTIYAQQENLAPTTYAYFDTGSFRGLLSSVTQGSGADIRTSTCDYDTFGRLSAITNPMGYTTYYDYDDANRLTTLTLPGSITKAYGYDQSGNLTSISLPEGGLHQFAFDPLDMLHSYNGPDIGGPATETAYTYDGDRQVTKIDRPGDFYIDYTHDSAGRLATTAIPTGSIGLSYNSGSGQVEQVSTSWGVDVTYGYDGPLLTSQSWDGEVIGQVTYEYNENLQIESIKLPGASTNFIYDLDGWIAQTGSLEIQRDNAASHLVTGTSLGNITHEFGYNEFGELTAIHVKYNGTPIYDCQYTKDKRGYITQKVETIDGVQAIYDYGYDELGQLISVAKNGMVISNFTYDDNGNRLTANGTAATYDAQDRLTQFGDISYTYTPSGELASKSQGTDTTLYTYDALGNLLSVTLPDGTVIEYVVDGLGRRVVKKKNGAAEKKFLYADPLRPIAELDQDNNLVSLFIYGTRESTPEYMVRDGEIYRIVTDHLESVRLVVNVADGSIEQRMDYDAFGNVIRDTNPGFQPFGFAGGIYDPDTGLVRFGFRDYDPQAGRWTAKDPILFSGSSLNLYSFVENNPVNVADPLGLGPSSISDLEILGLGATSMVGDLIKEARMDRRIASASGPRGRKTMSVTDTHTHKLKLKRAKLAEARSRDDRVRYLKPARTTVGPKAAAAGAQPRGRNLVVIHLKHATLAKPRGRKKALTYLRGAKKATSGLVGAKLAPRTITPAELGFGARAYSEGLFIGQVASY